MRALLIALAAAIAVNAPWAMLLCLVACTRAPSLEDCVREPADCNTAPDPADCARRSQECAGMSWAGSASLSYAVHYVGGKRVLEIHPLCKLASGIEVDCGTLVSQ